MSDMVALTSGGLPSHLKDKSTSVNMFAGAGVTGGFPLISIKGKVFHIQRGDFRDLVTKPDTDEPASSLEVVVLAANPNKSKVYYADGYEEGSAYKPTCYSNNGSSPASEAGEPQSKKCAICPHNQWGSRITDNGGKGKACSDSMRLCVAPAGQLNDPMLLRVPAATLKTLGNYGQQLAKRGVEPKHVVTKLSFDYEVAFPALTFKAIRFIDEDELAQVEQVVRDEEQLIGQITGVIEDSNSMEIAEGITPAPKKVKKPAPVKDNVEPIKRVKALDEIVAETEAAPKPKVKVEEEEPKAEVVEISDEDDIDIALDNLDFDD